MTVPDSWTEVRSDDPNLFRTLRSLPESEVCVSFGIGTGEGFRVAVPASRLRLTGRLRVEPSVDRFRVEVPGWSVADFAWFGRRKGRGRTDYWQGAVEYRSPGYPALVLYFTAPLDGLEIRLRTGEGI